MRNRMNKKYILVVADKHKTYCTLFQIQTKVSPSPEGIRCDPDDKTSSEAYMSAVCIAVVRLTSRFEANQ